MPDFNSGGVQLLTSHTIIAKPGALVSELLERGVDVANKYKGSGHIDHTVIEAQGGPYAGRLLLWLRHFVPTNRLHKAKPVTWGKML
jgi:hypothetical protein